MSKTTHDLAVETAKWIKEVVRDTIDLTLGRGDTTESFLPRVAALIETALAEALNTFAKETAVKLPCGHRVGCQRLGDETKGENPCDVFCEACGAAGEQRERAEKAEHQVERAVCLLSRGCATHKILPLEAFVGESCPICLLSARDSLRAELDRVTGERDKARDIARGLRAALDAAGLTNNLAALPGWAKE